MKAINCKAAGAIIGIITGLAIPATATEGWLVPESSANGTFGSVTVGASRNHDLKDAWNDGSISNTRTDEVDPAVKVTGGYKFNPYLAVQAAYHNLGKYKMAATSSGGPSWTAGEVTGEQKADGWSLSISGRLPISERWTFVGTIGWFWWTSEESYTLNGAPDGSLKENGSDLTVAGHFEFDHGLPDRIVYVAGLDHQRVGDDGYDITTGFAGVLYVFP